MVGINFSKKAKSGRKQLIETFSFYFLSFILISKWIEKEKQNRTKKARLGK